MNFGRRSSIPQVFQGQSILVTGGTGFVGMVLLEKLVRCCPGVSRIYLIVRPKRGVCLRQRIKDLLRKPFFDRCRSERGNINWCCGASEVAAMGDDGTKGPLVVGISGDMAEKGLGIDANDRSHLELHVTVVFHSAATVRFNEPLRQAVFLNTRGTREMLELASRMPLLKAFVHVSTAYAHVSNHGTRIGERFYSVPIEPEDIIKTVEEGSEEEYLEVSKKLATIYQNTYLCTKALAERIIEKDYSHLPVSIYRPGIVGPVHKSPVPGWTEGIQGPAIVLYACATGFFRVVFCDGTLKPEIVPVDHVVNAMMAVVWARSVNRSNKTVNGVKQGTPVFNHVSSNRTDITWDQFAVVANKVLRVVKETQRLEEIRLTSSYVIYELSCYVRLCLIKLMDLVNSLRSKKTDFTQIQKKAKSGMDTLSYFMVNTFKFTDDELINLRERCNKEASADSSGYDLSEFDFDITTVKWNDYIECYVVQVRQDLLKSHSALLQSSLRNSQIFKIIERAVGFAGIALSCASLYYMSSSLDWLYQYIFRTDDTET